MYLPTYMNIFIQIHGIQYESSCVQQRATRTLEKINELLAYAVITLTPFTCKRVAKERATRIQFC